ncbi:MAG: hypothetical protein ACREDR_03435, partial [Blastocatellia bacterium]
MNELRHHSFWVRAWLGSKRLSSPVSEVYKMAAMERKRVGIVSRKIFEVLLSHPEGMNTYSLLRSLEASLPAPANSTEPAGKRWLETLVRVGISAPAQAGWVLNNDGLWTVSAAGRKAYTSTNDPERFLDDAASRSARGWISVRFPRLYLAASRVKYQAGVETGLIRRLGIRRVIETATAARLGARSGWKEVLPVQPVCSVELEMLESPTTTLTETLRARGIEPVELEGTDCLYIAPSQPWKTLLNGVAITCPGNTALMIGKTSRSLDHAKGGDRQQDDLVLRANLLFQIGLGSRVYECFRLIAGNDAYRAYAVEHVEGTAPTAADFNAAVSTVEQRLPVGTLRIERPGGSGAYAGSSAVVTSDDRFAWRTFDDVKLDRYGKFLQTTALAASNVSHWGDRSILRGWKYLYQRVPGVALPGRRDCARRMDSIEPLMKTAGVSIKGKLVLDVGTNMGMMMAQYLNRGAGWCHGWDMASLTRYTERLLFSLGCTKFSVTGCELSKAREIEKDLPAFVSPIMDGCAISYLAVRGPLGWLDSLGRIPWSFII